MEHAIKNLSTRLPRTPSPIRGNMGTTNAQAPGHLFLPQPPHFVLPTLTTCPPAVGLHTQMQTSTLNHSPPAPATAQDNQTVRPSTNRASPFSPVPSTSQAPVSSQAAPVSSPRVMPAELEEAPKPVKKLRQDKVSATTAQEFLEDIGFISTQGKKRSDRRSDEAQ